MTDTYMYFCLLLFFHLRYLACIAFYSNQMHEIWRHTLQVQIDEAIQGAQKVRLEELCGECKISMKELDDIAQTIIDSCTKDAISVSTRCGK